MQIRLKFKKGEEVKYISHLDLMRTFQRAIRRAGIPIAYSSGFNPHQEISFGAPLALGTSSSAEYVDIKLARDMDMAEIKEMLNKNLPQGIKVAGGIKLPENAKSAMAIVTHARYTVRMMISDTGEDRLQQDIERFLEQSEIKVMKKQPKKDFELKETDIRPMIIGMKLIPGMAPAMNGEYFINCLLLSGSKSNLKPELLIAAFKEFTGYDIKGIRINREEVYADKNGKMVELLDYV